jgi:hypothetical protein
MHSRRRSANAKNASPAKPVQRKKTPVCGVLTDDSVKGDPGGVADDGEPAVAVACPGMRWQLTRSAAQVKQRDPKRAISRNLYETLGLYTLPNRRTDLPSAKA